MNNGWITCFLGEICDVTTGRRPNVKTNYPSNEMNIPVYGGNGIAWYTNEFLLNIDSPVILTGRVGTLGTYFRVVGKCWVSDNALIIIPRTVDPDFLYYYMKMLPIESLNRGSTQPLLTQSDLKQIRLFIPKDIKEQKKISNVLKILDAKIELNTDINKNLEEQAQALFKSWFIDFEPFGGTMPEDWNEVSLSDIAEFTSGYSYKGTELQNSNIAMATIKNFDRSSGFKLDGFKEIVPSEKLKETQRVNLFDILVAHTDLTQNAEIIGNAELLLNKSGYSDIILSMDLVKVTPKEHIVSPFLLALLLKNPVFKQHCLGYVNGTTVLHLSKKALPEYKLWLPADLSILNSLAVLIESLYKQISSNIAESTYLASIRDTLLPRLMSGEIDVSKVDISDPGCLDKLSFSDEGADGDK